MPPIFARIKSVPAPISIYSMLVSELNVSESFPVEPINWSLPAPPSMLSPPLTAPLNVKISSPPKPLKVSISVSA